LRYSSALLLKSFARPGPKSLALQNKKVVYGLLLRASAETLPEVGCNPAHLGGEDRRASGFLLTAFSNATPHTFFQA
jgi:hypothetical protein